MTFDVIAVARRRTRRTVGILLAVAPGVVAVSCVVGRNQSTGRPGVPAASTVEPRVPDARTPAGMAALPADVAWTLVAGVELPVSATVGPREMSDGLASGFAHTTEGAAVAASILGISRTKAYALAKEGDFPVKLVRADRRSLVPVPALLDLLVGNR